MITVEQLKALGFDCLGFRDGTPFFPGVFLKRVKGRLKAFKDKQYRPWEEPEPDRSISAGDIKRIQNVVDGDIRKLSRTDRASIAAVTGEEELRSKASAYASESDPLFFEWQAGMAEDGEPHEDLKLAWLAKRKEVRSGFHRARDDGGIP